MKSTRRVLTLVLALAMVLSLSLNLFAIPNDYDWAAQNRATDTYQVLYNAVYDKNDRPMRDDFAGSWYSQASKNQVVAVTEDGDMNFYRNLLKDFDNVEFVTCKYSLKALCILQDVVWDRLCEIMSAAGVMVMTNTVDFLVSVPKEEGRQRIVQLIQDVRAEFNLPEGIENAITVEHGFVEPATEDDEISVNRPTESRPALETNEIV